MRELRPCEQRPVTECGRTRDDLLALRQAARVIGDREDARSLDVGLEHAGLRRE